MLVFPNTQCTEIQADPNTVYKIIYDYCVDYFALAIIYFSISHAQQKMDEISDKIKSGRKGASLMKTMWSNLFCLSSKRF
jgi:hypothetical protein